MLSTCLFHDRSELAVTEVLGIFDSLEFSVMDAVLVGECRVRATDRHCHKLRRNNKFGAKNINLATTIGERKIASIFFCLASHCLVPLNGHQCVS